MACILAQQLAFLLQKGKVKNKFPNQIQAVFACPLFRLTAVTKIKGVCPLFRLTAVTKIKGVRFFNHFIPTSDQEIIFPYNINTISSRQVIRIEKNINHEIIS